VWEEKYEKTLKEFNFKEAQLNNSIRELREFRDELNFTYDNLLKKSAQLEYSNTELEMKVSNLSNLNAIARTVLSTLELDKIIAIILDAYFVLTGAKKIALYLWEDETLVRKKIKGKFRIDSKFKYPKELLASYKREDYSALYESLSRGFDVVSNEKIVIS